MYEMCLEISALGAIFGCLCLINKNHHLRATNELLEERSTLHNAKVTLAAVVQLINVFEEIGKAEEEYIICWQDAIDLLTDAKKNTQAMIDILSTLPELTDEQ